MKDQTVKCRDTACPKRLTCAIANGQVKGTSIIYTGYIDGKCNYYVKVKDGKK